jgi:hypothetical protein
MTARVLATLSAALEAATGVALIADPDLVARVLLGVGITGGGIVVGCVGGFALISLGLACWPRGSDAGVQVIWALLTYILLTALYLGYLRIGGGSSAICYGRRLHFMPCWRFC